MDACDTDSAIPDHSSIPTLQVDDDMDAIIGTIRLSGNIRCHLFGCAHTFGRPTDLKRHYTEFHAAHKLDWWCIEPMCERSIGGRSFRRKDKMRDHERKVHRRGIDRKRR